MRGQVAGGGELARRAGHHVGGDRALEPRSPAGAIGGGATLRGVLSRLVKRVEALDTEQRGRRGREVVGQMVRREPAVDRAVRPPPPDGFADGEQQQIHRGRESGAVVGLAPPGCQPALLPHVGRVASKGSEGPLGERCSPAPAAGPLRRAVVHVLGHSGRDDELAHGQRQGLRVRCVYRGLPLGIPREDDIPPCRQIHCLLLGAVGRQLGHQVAGGKRLGCARDALSKAGRLHDPLGSVDLAREDASRRALPRLLRSGLPRTLQGARVHGPRVLLADPGIRRRSHQVGDAVARGLADAPGEQPRPHADRDHHGVGVHRATRRHEAAAVGGVFASGAGGGAGLGGSDVGAASEHVAHADGDLAASRPLGARPCARGRGALIARHRPHRSDENDHRSGFLCQRLLPGPNVGPVLARAARRVAQRVGRGAATAFDRGHRRRGHAWGLADGQFRDAGPLHKPLGEAFGVHAGPSEAV
mmetsp:Transcript_68963/g.200072  ORF Transcript_68963/g.200072 Transcript_68963/m.200072 type:complete len:474 (-) Transcript_68963:2883-4304(-)